MKNIIISKIKYLLVFVFFLILTLLIPQTLAVKADSVINYSTLLPISDMEILNLNESGPVATAIYDGGVSLIKNDKSLLIYKNGKYHTYDKLERENPFQIKNLSDGKVIVNDDGVLYKINTNDLSVPPEKLLYNGKELLCRAFDVNGKYIVTVQGALVSLFTLNENYEITEKIEPKITAADLTPVGVNVDGTIFYINAESNLLAFKDLNDSIVCHDAGDVKAFSFDQEKIYFIKGNDVYLSQKEEGSVVKLSLPETDYDLGKIINPTDISVYNGNLIITCANSIQEYKNVDQTLEFTGFAIADDKTAFNRVGKNVINIERYKDTLAVLDDYKITLIDLNKELSKESFKNLRVNKQTEDFALGEKTLLYKNGGIFLINLTTLEETPIDLSVGEIKDVIYQSGYYYLLSGDGVDDSVTKISESGEVVSTLPAEKVGYNSFNVDVFGKVIYAENGESKITTDLNGNAFSVKNSTFYSLSDKAEYNIDKDVSSFALSFDKKEIYFTIKNQTGIYKTDKLPNIAIEELGVPETYNQNKEKALKQTNTYTVKDGENIYGMEAGEKFVFTKLLNPENEYYLTGEIKTGNLSMLLLSSKGGTVLVNKNSVIENQIVYGNSPLKLFITTSVHAHYIPVLTLQCENYLYSDNEEIKLKKGDVVITDGNSLMSFDGKDFYFVTLEFNGKEIGAFIPSAFTVEVESEEYVLKEFTLKQVNKTNFYTDETMQNTAFTIDDGTYVKILSNDGQVSKISLSVDNGYIVGYINSSAIKNSPNVALRNILIIVVLSVCVLGTTMFFVLRKKN